MNPLGISYGQTAGVGGQAGLAQIVKGADLNPFEIYQKGQAQLAGVEAQRIKAKQDIDKQDADTLKELQQKTLEYDFTDKKAVDAMTQEMYSYAKEYKAKNPYKALSTDPEFQKKYMDLQNTYRASKDASDEYKRIMEMKQSDSPWIDVNALQQVATQEMEKGVNNRNLSIMADVNNPKFFSRNRATTDLLSKVKDAYKNGDAMIKQGNFGIETISTDGNVRFLGDDGKPGISTNLARYLLSEPAYARKVEADIKNVVNTEVQAQIEKGDKRNRQDIENDVLLKLSPDGMNGLMIEQAKKDALVHQQIANKKEIKNDNSFGLEAMRQKGAERLQALKNKGERDKKRYAIADRYNLLVNSAKGDMNSLSSILQNIDDKSKKVTFNMSTGQKSGTVVGLSSNGRDLGDTGKGFKPLDNKGYIFLKNDEGKIVELEFDNDVENGKHNFARALQNIIESTANNKKGEESHYFNVGTDKVNKLFDLFKGKLIKDTEYDDVQTTNIPINSTQNKTTPTKKEQPKNNNEKPITSQKAKNNLGLNDD